MTFVLWLVALSAGLYFRLYPFIHQTTSNLYDRATLVVLSRLQTTARLHIQKNFPQQSELQKKYLSKRYFDKILHEEKENVLKSIENVYSALTQNQTSLKTIPYLLEADPYNYYGLTRNIVEKGAMSPIIKGSKYFNERMLAPLGHWEPLNLNPYVGYLTYKFLKVFKPGIPLMLAVSFVPLLISVLAAIVFWQLVRFLGCSSPAAFIGSFFFLLSPIFVKRSAFGWYDNDPYNIFFPLFILQIFFLGLSKKASPKICLVFGGLCALSITLYAFFWQGWMFILCILLPASLLIAFHNLFVPHNQKNTKTLSLYLTIVNLGTFFGVSLAFGFQDFFILFKEGWQALKNFLEPQFNLWPDMFIGVGELRKISLLDLIDLNGGILFFIIAVVGFFCGGFKSLRSPKTRSNLSQKDCFVPCPRRDRGLAITLDQFIVLLLLTAFSILTALGAQRFALLSLIPLSIFFALGIQCLLEMICSLIPSHPSLLVGRFRKGVIIMTAVLMLIIPLRTAHEEMLFWRPIFNETWDAALTKIRQQTPAESIINAWWPPGHFITSIAQRRVTFDGATINFPQAYWMADVFLNQDEESAVGVLRMLNSSANQGADYLKKCGLRLSAAVETLKTITKLNKDEANSFLKDKLSPEQIEKLLALTHALPPPSYLFVYSEQIEKNLELSFVGKWNFKKAEELQANPQALAQLPKRNSSEYIRFLWDSVGGPLRNSETLPEIMRKDKTILFDKGIAVDLETLTVLINSKEFGRGKPLYLIYFDGNTVRETKQENASLNISVLMIKENNGRHHCQLIDYTLAKSLLFQLYYFQGKGLKYFQPFIHEVDLTGRTDIYVYKIDWEKFLNDIGDD